MRALVLPFIYGTLAVPHIGHLYTSVIADVLARYVALKRGGGPSFLNTGTDEHGFKIQHAAQRAGMEPKVFCDEISRRFKVGLTTLPFARTSILT
jgi:methionyl-tRNA synthetase